MNAALCQVPFPAISPMPITGPVNLQPDGTYTVSTATGEVHSLLPGGTVWETRPAGTAGPYEKCTIVGTISSWNPDGNGPYLFSIIPEVPNT